MPIDYSLYPADWPEISRRIRYERAGNRCEWCGAENGKPHPVTGSKVVLTVAHIDHNIENNDDSNLAALCQRCHLTLDAGQHRRNIVCMATQQGGAEITENYCPTITEAAGTSGNNQPIVCMATGQGGAETGENCAVNLTCNHEAPIVGAFMPGQGAKAGSIAYSEDHAPALRAGDSGTNRVPAVVCLNDQGGSVMRIEKEGAIGTLRANTHGNNPIICVHGSQDPITNTDHANAVNRNNGLENCVYQYGEVAGTLTERHDSSPCDDRGMNIVYEKHMQDSRVKECGQCSPQINAKAGTGGGNLPLVQSIAIAENIIGRQIENGGNGVGAKEEVAYTQNCTGVMGVSQNETVRRLTPVECERLMGFPDNWTRIPWKLYQECVRKGWSFEAELEKRGKKLKTTVDDCPDSPRYKACGNSMCVNVMRWIGMRIELAERKGTLC